MTASGPKAHLHRYLQVGREAVLWKLEGLSEYDIRRPLTPTGTNLLGEVPWWPEGARTATLHRILVHVVAETHRHAGHADIVREIIDGAVGLRDGNENMTPGDQEWWDDHRRRLERVAQDAHPS